GVPVIILNRLVTNVDAIFPPKINNTPITTLPNVSVQGIDLKPGKSYLNDGFNKKTIPIVKPKYKTNWKISAKVELIFKPSGIYKSLLSKYEFNKDDSTNAGISSSGI